ncbi:TPA: hypothetical protein EYP37_10240 [Candidatus Poribacteria bacterium]|nr:hypothetical protein [Candidatus Poribacteria bacterium]
MKITILTGSDELNISLERYLRFTLEVEQVLTARLGHPETLESEMMSSDLWIAEVFNPQDPQNPEGFRTAKKLADKVPFLLLFIGDIPADFPKEGDFWLVMPSSTSLSSKIRDISNSPPPSEEDYRSLEEMWPLLGREPYHHHHR